MGLGNSNPKCHSFVREQISDSLRWKVELLNQMFAKNGLIIISQKGFGEITVPLKILSVGVYPEEFAFFCIQNSLLLWSCVLVFLVEQFVLSHVKFIFFVSNKPPALFPFLISIVWTSLKTQPGWTQSEDLFNCKYSHLTS